MVLTLKKRICDMDLASTVSDPHFLISIHIQTVEVLNVLFRSLKSRATYV